MIVDQLLQNVSVCTEVGKAAGFLPNGLHQHLVQLGQITTVKTGTERIQDGRLNVSERSERLGGGRLCGGRSVRKYIY